MASGGGPALSGEAQAAVEYRGGNLQIVAGAGTGKTEVVAQRVAALLAEGVSPGSIVAFTFTEKAANELKGRIELRVQERLGAAAADRLTRLFVGTIHGYCLRLLQEEVPGYDVYEVLDDHGVAALLSREAYKLELRDLDEKKRLYAAIKRFLRNLQVVECELLDPEVISPPFGNKLRSYIETLDRYRVLPYGQLIVRAVKALEGEELRTRIHKRLRHLIVDEYQDVNKAQVELIKRLKGPEVDLCVVGDDQQAIYQWRGSDANFIIEFSKEFAPVKTFHLLTNRRSRPCLVDLANGFAEAIPERIEKRLNPARPDSDGQEVCLWRAGTEAEEAERIAELIAELHEQRQIRYREIAILVRGKVAFQELRKQLSKKRIPVQVAGRTGLFEEDEAVLLGKTVAWVAGVKWPEQSGRRRKVKKGELVEEYAELFDLQGAEKERLAGFLDGWKAEVRGNLRPPDLLEDYYELLERLEVKKWDPTDEFLVGRLGTLARFSALLKDFESVWRRAWTDPDASGKQRGRKAETYRLYKDLASYIINYASGAYEGFDGVAEERIEAVALMTVHRAKGLEWPVVFLPSLTKKRFAPKNGEEEWLVPPELFNAKRYEGGDADERRLFYVAITRARDWLSLSCHKQVTKRRVKPSPYFEEIASIVGESKPIVSLSIEQVAAQEGKQLVSYSALALFLECPFAFRFREHLGFQPRFATELGYGRAVHAVLRALADRVRESGQLPSEDDLERLVQDRFYLPYAAGPEYRTLLETAKRLIKEYCESYSDDLYRAWDVDRPFELRLDSITVTGTADVIVDQGDGAAEKLAILDYKTSTNSTVDYHLQLQVYASAAKREGLEVSEAILHDLKEAKRVRVPIDDRSLEQAEQRAKDAADQIRRRWFKPRPALSRCKRCEVRTLCSDAEH